MWPQPNGSGMPPQHYQAAPMAPRVDQYGQQQWVQLPQQYQRIQYEVNQMTYPAYDYQTHQYNQQWPQGSMMVAQQGGMEYAQSQWQFRQRAHQTHQTSLFQQAIPPNNFGPGPEPTQQSIKSPATIIPPCDNCGGTDHMMQFCTKSIDRRGYMTGCPPCNTKLHNYRDPHACKYPYTSQSDLYFVVICRHNRPPLMAKMDFRDIEGFEKGTQRPWTPEFALKMEANGFLANFKHQLIVREEKLVPDPTWGDLAALKAFNEKYSAGTLIHPHYRQQLNTTTGRAQAVSATPVQQAGLPRQPPLPAPHRRRVRRVKQRNPHAFEYAVGRSSNNNRELEAVVKNSLTGQPTESSLAHTPQMNHTPNKFSIPLADRNTRIPERVSSGGIRKERPNKNGNQRSRNGRVGTRGQTIDELIFHTSATFPHPPDS